MKQEMPVWGPAVKLPIRSRGLTLDRKAPEWRRGEPR
jgi:hypothetical protein